MTRILLASLALTLPLLAHADVWDLKNAQEAQAREAYISGEVQKHIGLMNQQNAALEKAFRRFAARHGIAGPATYQHAERMKPEDMVIDGDFAIAQRIPSEVKIAEITFRTADGYECSFMPRGYSGGDAFCIHTVTGQRLEQFVSGR